MTSPIRRDFIGQLEKLAREHRVSFGRFDVSLPVDERYAGLTVNEYETLLMTHDLRDLLTDPFRFVAQIGREALQAPRAIPAKALNYAQYDAVQVFNTLMDRVGVRRSLVERVVNRALALSVSHFLRLKRGISLPVLDRQGDGVGGIGWGTYQSPILIQWKSSGRSPRALNVRLVQPQPRPGIVTLRLTTVADAQYGGFTTDSRAVFWGSIDSRCVNVTVPTLGHCLTLVRAVGTIHAWILVEGDATVIICLKGNLL